MVDDKLITTRNLVDGDFGALRRFTGVLDSMPIEDSEFGEGDQKKKSKRVTLNFKEIEVIEAVEPYAFPTYSTRPMTLSNRKKSVWGVLGESFNDLVDHALYSEIQLKPKLDDGSDNPDFIKPADRMDIESCIGKRFGLVLADGENGRPDPPLLFDGRANEGQGADVPRPTWMVYSVEGVAVAGGSGKTPYEAAMELLDGRTAAEFNDKVLADQYIRSDTALLSSMSKPESAPDSFLATMVSTGQFTKDAGTGVYTRKKA